MATPCGNPEVHGPHPWEIGPNPGEPGPDEFWCDGRTTRLIPWSSSATGEIPLGRVSTDHWPAHSHAYTSTTHFPPQGSPHRLTECVDHGCPAPQTEFLGGEPVAAPAEAVSPFVLVCHDGPCERGHLEEQLRALVAKWNGYDGVSSNPGDVEDDAFANGTEWGQKMAATDLRVLLGDPR